MNQIRSLKFRKWALIIFLIVGVFPQIQAVFACEKIDDRVQFKSDCMPMGDTSMPCVQMQDCLSGMEMTTSDECCDLTNDNTANVRNIAQNLSLEKILLLDGPQPPPLIPSIIQIVQMNGSILYQRFIILSLDHFSVSDTYLQTQRFRI